MLSQLLPKITLPVIFWLDAHYSRSVTAKGAKESPIIFELKAIFELCNTPWIILIDDARLFGYAQDYPSVEEIIDLIKQCGLNCQLTVSDDIIKIMPMSVNSHDIDHI
jgi:hypothetical protein